ncbi:MAG: hypothetical protein QM743_11255 [Chitinophagaceae bacterium]
MKRILHFAAMAGVLFLASCAKNDKGLNANQWSISGKTIQADKVDISYTGNYISGVNGDGSSLTASFKALPTASADYNVNTEATGSADVAVRVILSGNLVYNGIPQANKVSVRVTGGTYTMIMNDIKLVNAGNEKDTVIVSCNLVQ